MAGVISARLRRENMRPWSHVGFTGTVLNIVRRAVVDRVVDWWGAVDRVVAACSKIAGMSAIRRHSMGGDGRIGKSPPLIYWLGRHSLLLVGQAFAVADSAISRRELRPQPCREVPSIHNRAGGPGGDATGRSRYEA